MDLIERSLFLRSGLSVCSAHKDYSQKQPAAHLVWQ